jgi:hypothetical protein
MARLKIWNADAAAWEYVNAPSSGGSQPPFSPAGPGDDLVLLENTSGDPLIYGGDDAGGAYLSSPDGSTQVVVTDGGARMIGTSLGFYDAGAVARPVVPLTTPDAQDIIDALVSLGLVTQSD